MTRNAPRETRFHVQRGQLIILCDDHFPDSPMILRVIGVSVSLRSVASVPLPVSGLEDQGVLLGEAAGR